MTDLNFTIPKPVLFVSETLEKAGFEAFLVGGCVRDMLLNKVPKDWDITTNAKPDVIESLFPKTFYENRFGTVSVVHEDEEDPRLKVIEVTPYRIESDYSDNRRPDSVSFSDKLENDLERRDFTINALAYSVSRDTIVDLHNGRSDLHSAIITTVGDPKKRFDEDALRILRAVRLSAELGFTISSETMTAIEESAPALQSISVERIRDEFIKIIESPNPTSGILVAQKLGVLKYIVPELEEGIGIEQNGDHIYTVWEHNIRALQHASERAFPLHVKLAALFHDISKPETRRWSDDKNNWTFYGHDVVGGKVAKQVLQRLKFPKQTINDVSVLVRNHLFFSDIDKITLSAVRRIIRNVGEDLIWDLMDLRACDRIGMGRPKEKPYRLRKYQAMIEEALRAPVSVARLNIDGKTVMEVTHETPGKRIGFILNALLGEALDNPDINEPDILVEKAQQLSQLADDELSARAESGIELRDELEQQELKTIHKKHKVD